MSEFKDFVVRGACDLSVRDYGGAGSPVLLLHGGTRNLADWTPFASHLVLNHHVVAMDLRNHGHSGDGEWELNSVLDDVERVVDATGLVRPALAGHSLGGMIAALFSARGGSASCVVNMDGYGMGQPSQYVGLAADAVHGYLQEALDSFIGSWPGASAPITVHDVDGMIRDRIAQATALRIPVVLELESALRSLRDLPDHRIGIQPSAVSMRGMFDAIADVDWFDVFAEVKVPFLIYRCVAPTPFEEVGERTPFFSSYREGLQRDFAALGARSRNVVVRKMETHHLFNLSIPHIVATEVHEFIESAHAADEGASCAVPSI